MSLMVRGSAGELVVPMFPVPHEGDSLALRRDGEPEVVEHLGTRTSYTYQLEAFAAAVRQRTPVLTDAAYSASGLRTGAAVRG